MYIVQFQPQSLQVRSHKSKDAISYNIARLHMVCICLNVILRIISKQSHSIRGRVMMNDCCKFSFFDPFHCGIYFTESRVQFSFYINGLRICFGRVELSGFHENHFKPYQAQFALVSPRPQQGIEPPSRTWRVSTHNMMLGISKETTPVRFGAGR
jgi:hypothetical protein